MSPPLHLCMIFESIGPYNAIGKVAMAEIEVALEAGLRVTVVAKSLHESLHDRVEWLKLHVPRRGFALQWLTGRHFIKRALGKRRFDIVHGHQPQIADLCDVFQCHFLTRVAHERGCLARASGWRSLYQTPQQYAVLPVEDFFYRQWNPRTHLLFGSEMMRREFDRLYGLPPSHEVMLLPLPPFNLPTEAERLAARQRFVGDHPGPVLGYLGGVQKRKGYHRMIEALRRESDSDVMLLMGGIFSEGFRVPDLEQRGRFRAVGLVQDTEAFYAACDVFIVPSLFEPTGLVAFEAVARGVPVIATEEVGALPHLLEYGAGVCWQPDQPLTRTIHDVSDRRDAMVAGAERLLADHGAVPFGKHLLELYDRVHCGKRLAIHHGLSSE